MAYSREEFSITSQIYFLSGIFILALALRLIFSFVFLHHGTNAWLPFDSDQYYRIAQNLCTGNGICFSPGHPQMYRLPGYPFFLAVCLMCGDITQALLVQIIMSCLIPVLIFFLTLRLNFSLSCARCAAVMSCFHAGFITYAGMVATETLFLIILLCFFIIFLPCMSLPWCLPPRTCSLLHMLGAGAMLGILSLIRPVGHYMVALCAIMLALSITHKDAYKKIVTLIASWFICVAPWLVRNFMLCGAFCFHTLPGLHFLQYTAAYIVMERDHCSYADARPVLMHQRDVVLAQETQKIKKALNDYEQCCCTQKIAQTYIVNHPWLFLKTACIQMLKTLSGLYAAQPLMTDAERWPTYTYHTTLWTKIKRFLLPDARHRCLIFFIYYEIILWILLLIGLLSALIAAWYDVALRCALAKTLPFLLLFVGITLAYGCARLRLPIEPFIIIFSGVGWLWLHGHWSKKKNVS
ncbi:MAG: hypothetical protein WC365_06010 [Candidatus Babeliales bacterium]|jgi:hypothetical protein